MKKIEEADIKRCSTCKFWTQDKYFQNEGVCTGIDNQLAITIESDDGEAYAGDTITLKDFGCVLHKPKII